MNSQTHKTHREYRLPYTNGLLDWDCAEAIRVAAMAEALSYIRQHASFPVSPPLLADDPGTLTPFPVAHARIHRGPECRWRVSRQRRRHRRPQSNGRFVPARLAPAP